LPNSVLITGASGGIGRALALEFAAPGRVLLLNGRNADKLGALAQECRRRGAVVTELIQDLRQTEQWIARLEAVSRESPIDLAIVNAGVLSVPGADGETWNNIEEVLAVNVKAAFATVSGVLPAMRARGRGQIALMSSLAAWYGLPAAPSYCASKAALKSYGEALRVWLAPQGIGVSVVLAGDVKTGMSEQWTAAKRFVISPERAARLIRRGLARDCRRISFPFPLSWGAWLLSALPTSLSERIVRTCKF